MPDIFCKQKTQSYPPLFFDVPMFLRVLFVASSCLWGTPAADLKTHIPSGRLTPTLWYTWNNWNVILCFYEGLLSKEHSIQLILLQLYQHCKSDWLLSPQICQVLPGTAPIEGGYGTMSGKSPKEQQTHIPLDLWLNHEWHSKNPMNHMNLHDLCLCETTWTFSLSLLCTLQRLWGSWQLRHGTSGGISSEGVMKPRIWIGNLRSPWNREYIYIYILCIYIYNIYKYIYI